MSEQLPSIILASISPRRRELVSLFGFREACQFISADVDESIRENESPEEMVTRLARAKAEIGAQHAERPDSIIIAADTTVEIDGKIIGKPVDREDAVRMLKLLRNRPHTVFSGLTVRRGNQELTQIATTLVHMRNYSDEEIAAYVATGDPLDKAAAYAIQHRAFHPVERVEGCYANVMGLPLCHLHRALKAFGLAVNEPDEACQAHLNIVSPVARQILEEDVKEKIKRLRD